MDELENFRLLTIKGSQDRMRIPWNPVKIIDSDSGLVIMSEYSLPLVTLSRDPLLPGTGEKEVICHLAAGGPCLSAGCAGCAGGLGETEKSDQEGFLPTGAIVNNERELKGNVLWKFRCQGN